MTEQSMTEQSMTDDRTPLSEAAAALTAQAVASARLSARLSRSMLRLRQASPFFATLAMHARFVESADIPTAATDGRDVFYNPSFLGGLSDPHLDGVMLHEVLHAALAHVVRRGRRDPRLWNIAADVVVNGLVIGNGFDLPDGHVRDMTREGLSVEEVYTALENEPDDETDGPDYDDLMELPGDGEAPEGDRDGDGRNASSLRAQRARAMERHWDRIARQAATAQRASGRGDVPLGAARAFGLEVPATVDWRAVLWQFVSRARSDFATFDRRFAYRGLYLETLENEDLEVDVCVDTSGSIDEPALAVFGAELDAILRAYPGVRCRLWYADAEAYGPWDLEGGDELPPPIGGGGTDFGPFFTAVAETTGSEGVCVYLTDGYGAFPATEPTRPTLWVVTPGGAPDTAFTFGEVIRLGG
jgi:predicted metal-dependent peptidase